MFGLFVSHRWKSEMQTQLQIKKLFTVPWIVPLNGSLGLGICDYCDIVRMIFSKCNNTTIYSVHKY
jgi:hypothetical protein